MPLRERWTEQIGIWKDVHLYVFGKFLGLLREVGPTVFALWLALVSTRWTVRFTYSLTYANPARDPDLMKSFLSQKKKLHLQLKLNLVF